MQVEIKNVEVEWVAKGRSKYGKAKVEYSYNGQARSQNIMSFANPEVFKKVQELVGKTVEVEVGKNDSGFSEWKSIQVPSGGSASSDGSANRGASVGTTRVSGSNYETKEERAARQVLIVKQSTLSVAKDVLIHNAGKDKVDPEAVKGLAQNLTDWVFETDPPRPDNSGFDNMENDIPF